MTRIAITGAGGFLGRSVVKAAMTAGADVVALHRSAGGQTSRGVSWHGVDLGGDSALDRLPTVLADVQAVIHAAASFAGDDAAQARDTLKATQQLISAMQQMPAPPKLVLVSSFSVYDIASLPDFSLLSEDSPLIAVDADRDAYARAKRQQEIMVQDSGLTTTIVRPGAIYGPGRLWSAQLGFARFGRVFCPGGDALVPAVGVDQAADSLVQAALRDGARGLCINMLDPDPPTQGGWLAALGMPTLFVSRRQVLAVGTRLGRRQNWAARFKPLAYDARRARDVLGHTPRGRFAQMIADAKAQETA